MKVKVFTASTTGGVYFGLVNAVTGDVLHNATARWKTAKGAANYAKKMGYLLIW